VTEPKAMLEAVRRELQKTVLPRIEGDYERSVVIAMLGILRDVGAEIALDERKITAENESLRAALEGAIALAAAKPFVVPVAERLGAALAEPAPIPRRRLLLDAAETLVRELWRDPALEAERTLLLPRIRTALGGRLTLEP
jgi:hypothetical protein